MNVDWPTGIITVNKSDMTEVTANVLYTLDVDSLRLTLKDLEDDLAGMPWPKTHDHIGTYEISGVTYDRAVSILDPYTLEFEDGQYTVVSTGANHNLADVKVANQVSLITNNSAGRTVVGSAVTAQDITDIADASADQVWDTLTSDTRPTGSYGDLARKVKALAQAALGR